MAETLLEELKRYVRFDAGDEAALRDLHAAAAPCFPSIADQFYDRILSHEQASQALRGGEAQIGHLKITLQAWLDRLLAGPWDQEYFESRCRIGHVHVRIGLQQHYMFAAMNVVRGALEGVIEERCDGSRREAARRACGKILDLELAIMLHTYREDLLAQQARVERLSTFGQLAASIGHDLRNPLTVIETSLYVLRQRAGSDARTLKHVDRIGEQLSVANGIIGNLLDIIRDQPLARQPVEIGRVVASAADSIRRPVEIALELDERLALLPPLQGDPGQLRQVFANLLENAVQAASPRGQVRVVAGQEPGKLLVSVEDSGPGVDRAVAQRLFEPLVTTKAHGIGLGLALVKRIVERHGGSVGYQTRSGGGARFTVQLPL